MSYQPETKTISVRIAKNPIERMRGLMAKDALLGADALMLIPCKSIHSFGMHRPIDVAFIDKNGFVLKSITNLQPCRIVNCIKARAVLERFGDSSTQWLATGDRITLPILQHAGASKRNPVETISIYPAQHERNTP